MEKSAAVGRAVRARGAPCASHLEPAHTRDSPSNNMTQKWSRCLRKGSPAASAAPEPTLPSALARTEAGRNRELWHVNRKATDAEHHRRDPGLKGLQRSPGAGGATNEERSVWKHSGIKSREGRLAPGCGTVPAPGAHRARLKAPYSPLETGPGGVANLEQCEERKSALTSSIPPSRCRAVRHIGGGGQL